VSAAAIITGSVAHERFRPASHRFTYPLFCLRIPLNELAKVGEQLAVNRRGLISFSEHDHGARDGSSLLAWITEVLCDEGVIAKGEQPNVALHTFPRMFGYVFNPVSFWVCSHGNDDGVVDRHVFAVLVEVNNTFGQSHRYLLTNENAAAIQSGQWLVATKQLHVSPFNEVKGGYRFRFHFSADRWLARIDYADNGYRDGNVEDNTRTLLHTHISGIAQPLTRANLRRAALRFPLQSLAVVARIHWHALRLFIKRVPFFGKLRSHMTGISRS
jgi:uncharacterized protein